MDLAELKSNIKRGNLDLEEMDLKSVFFGMVSFFIIPSCHYSCAYGCSIGGMKSILLRQDSCDNGCVAGCLISETRK